MTKQTKFLIIVGIVIVCIIIAIGFGQPILNLFGLLFGSLFTLFKRNGKDYEKELDENLKSTKEKQEEIIKDITNSKNHIKKIDKEIEDIKNKEYSLDEIFDYIKNY